MAKGRCVCVNVAADKNFKKDARDKVCRSVPTSHRLRVRRVHELDKTVPEACPPRHYSPSALCPARAEGAPPRVA
jgi:hypothetical protein